ncbi:MAG TPA: FHA domain-containing protein [Burkholderiaceae bacterium]|nr:FHA domain-containing protein [Burkholderiaceae bacterium]
MPQLVASVEGVEIKRFTLANDRTTLGRKPHNDIVFDNLVVSGEHCAFELKGVSDVYVQDLGSTNGTYVNDHMIKARQLLHDGDVLAIGNFKLQFLAASAPSGFPETIMMKSSPAAGAGAAPALHASFQILTGSSAGLEVPVVKAVSTFGKPGVALVAVSHRRTGYFVGYMDGATRPLLNGKPLGEEAVPLVHEDVLELAGTKMRFVLKE